MCGVTFRKATLNDVEILTELRQRQLQEEGAIPKDDIAASIRQYFISNIENGTFVSWLACTDRIVATSGIVFYSVPPYYGNTAGLIGQIANMYTLKEYRRKGIARELLYRVISEAENIGCTTIRVSASEMGKLLYENYGFSVKENMLELNL